MQSSGGSLYVHACHSKAPIYFRKITPTEGKPPYRWSAENEVARRMIDGIGTCPVDDVSPDHECQFGLSENAAFLLLELEGQLRVADPASENLRAGHSKASFAAVSDWTAILSQ
jgi:hypothetical protein